MCALWKRLANSKPFRTSWHGIRDSPLNPHTRGFAINSGWWLGRSKKRCSEFLTAKTNFALEVAAAHEAMESQRAREKTSLDSIAWTRRLNPQNIVDAKPFWAALYRTLSHCYVSVCLGNSSCAAEEKRSNVELASCTANNC